LYKLVVLDLSDADVPQFEEYEKLVIPLLSQYGARMEAGYRSADGLTETHVLYFPDQASFESFLTDPVRTAKQDEFQRIGASASVTDVREIAYV